MSQKAISELTDCKRAYANGENIIQLLKTKYKDRFNLSEMIEISYDLQSGTYIDYFNSNKELYKKVADEKAEFIKKHFPAVSSLCDCGCGELTSDLYLFQCLKKITTFFAFDISWSRVRTGAQFFTLNQMQLPKLFLADIGEIPLPDNSIDVVITQHALEPNHGSEEKLIKELVRVARYGCVLFEPSYELGTDEQKKRMEKHGYIRGLPQLFSKLDVDLVENKLLHNYTNELNRTAAYIIKKTARRDTSLSA